LSRRNWLGLTTTASLAAGIAISFWHLVYHDAVLTTCNPSDLRGLLNADLPQIGNRFDPTEENLILINRMSQLNKRLAFTEMIKHEFTDASYHKERSVFADGTTITVD